MKILQGEIGSEITLKSIENEDSFMINSPGGSLFEGLAMYDYVKSKKIDVGVIGLCASAATLPLLASPTRWGTPHSRYLIHNPALSIFLEQYNSDELKKMSDELRIEQERALNLYLTELNGTKDEIQNLMNSERIIDANEALSLGLILEIRNMESDNEPAPQETDLKLLYNKYQMKINEQMENKELQTRVSKVEKILATVAKLFMTPKMIILQDVNGVELDFGNDIEAPEQIEIGAKATANGEPANGNYIMPDGRTFSFENGVLTAILEPMVEDTAKLEKELESLKEENQALRSENEKVKNELTLKLSEKDSLLVKASKELESAMKEIKDIKSKFSIDEPDPIIPPGKDQVKKFSYKR